MVNSYTLRDQIPILVTPDPPTIRTSSNNGRKASFILSRQLPYYPGSFPIIRAASLVLSGEI